MNILNKRLFLLFVCWLVCLAFLFFIVEQEKPANQKFTFIKLFPKYNVSSSPPLIPSAVIPTKREELIKIEPVVEEYHLLPKGREKGKGSIGELQIEVGKDGSLTFILPYTGTLTNYYSSNFTKGNIHARVLNFPGTWKAEYLYKRLPEGLSARLIQIVVHSKELRCSISAAYGMKALEEEVRYTDSKIIIHIRPKVDDAS